jgi:hypothetical protein
MTTINDTTHATFASNPFLSDDVFPRFVELTGDPVDAVRLADDAHVLLEYVAACTVAQQIGAAVPDLPELGSQFLRDLGAVAGQWLQRCLGYAANEAKSAVASFEGLRTEAATRAPSQPSDFLSTVAGREIFAAFARAARGLS